MNNDEAEKQSSELRKRVEKMLLNKEIEFNQFYSKEKDTLIYELNLHQTELEIQNEEIRKAYLELEDVKNNYFDLFYNAPVGYLILDNDMKICSANKIGAHIIGIEEDKILHTFFTKYIAKKDADIFHLAIKSINVTHKQNSYKFQLNCVDRKAKAVNAILMKLKGKNEGFRIILEDITDKQRIESFIIMSGRILKILNQPFDDSDIISNIIEIIKEETGFDAIGLRLKLKEEYPYYKTIGFREDFISNADSIAVMNKKEQFQFTEKENAILECICGAVISGKLDIKMQNLTKNGGFWNNNFSQSLEMLKPYNMDIKLKKHCILGCYNTIALLPIFYENTTIGLLQMNDKRKDMLDAALVEILEEICSAIGIALKRKSLFEENSVLINNLKIALKEREEAIFYKSEFIGNISHEIRTPLNGILGFTELLQFSENLTDRQKENLEYIKLSGHRLRDLLSDILEISKIEAHKINIIKNVFDTSELKKNIESTFLFNLKEDNVNLVFKICGITTIYSDSARINQILLNLVGNAIKFSLNGIIEITIEKTNNEIIFIVKDNGPGIRKNIAENIFEPFFVGENSKNKKYIGTGLGLSICKRLVELLGGKIWFKSVKGKGTCFYFTIPIEFPD